MERITRTYTLRRFSNSRDPDFASALGIYVTNIAPDGRTNSNEITYWLDRSYSEFGDDFIVIGFYVDKRLIGFSELAFFHQQRVLIIDYLVLHKAHRSHGEYFQFVRMMQDWLDQERIEYDYSMADVSFESSEPDPSEHSILLVHLFQQMGFRVAQCEYYQALLGSDNPQSDMRAHLLIASREQLPSIKRETLLHIVKTNYFNHHERWYSAFLDDGEEYKRHIERRFQDFEKRIKDRSDILLNGIKLLHPPILPSKAPRAARRITLIAPLIVLAAYLIFCGTFFVIQWKTQLDIKIASLLFASSLIVFAAVFALFNKNAQATLSSLLDTITNFFGKKK